MDGYLSWGEKTITDFYDENIDSLYNEGYVFTRLGKGVMTQTRSLRIDLDKFELSSENRRVLKKIEGLNLNITAIPYKQYAWQIGKMAKDFYDTKFGKGIFSANKIKELLTSPKSNFNTLLVYSLPPNRGELEGGPIGYAICYANSKIIHYSYPFYRLQPATDDLPATSYQLPANTGMGMMIMAIMAAKQNGKKYIYLGSAQRPTDVYKLQFKGVEWFDGGKWNTDLKKLKEIL